MEEDQSFPDDTTLKNYIQQTDYFMKDVECRVEIEGKQKRCLILNIDKCPTSLKEHCGIKVKEEVK